MKKYRWKARRSGLGRIGIDPVTARQNGCFKEQGNNYCRQPKLTNIIEGRETKVAFSFDIVVDAFYTIISANELQPSHNGNIENPLHFLPEAQPRNRATSQSGAETPRIMAQSLRPAEIIEGANAYTGAPIVNQRGEVIQGNGRAYAMKYYWDNNTKDSKGYLDYLNQNYQYFGFDGRFRARLEDYIFKEGKYPVAIIAGGMFLKGEKLTDYKTVSFPVLVRMVNISDTEAIKLGQYKQSDLEALSTKTNELKSRVNLIDDEKFARVLESVFVESEAENTLSETIRNSNLLAQLIRIGAIRADQLEEYVKNGSVNAKGVQYVSDLLLSSIFKGADVNTPEIFEQLPYKIQSAILKSVPYLLRLKSATDIKKEVATSLIATRDFLSSGYGNVPSWEKTVAMFGDNPRDKFSDFERKLVSIYTTSRTQKEIVDYFKNYLKATTDQPADLVTAAIKGLSKKEGIDKVFFGIEETPQPNFDLKLLKAKLELEMLLAGI